ncbi:REP-associated tyrosine transposase [Methylobacter sp.]|uniref:REP-associated tyrosine transposase n=1 Tax=Methylobacter sp. TaxID=2051955 RepID=UPI003DA36D3C
MAYDDLRKGRVSIPGQIYFITTVTANREPLFRCLYTGRLIVDEMRRSEIEGRLHTLAWVLMPDHLHWLVALGDHTELSAAVKIFKASSARRVNDFLQRRGSLWQRAYYDHALRGDEDIKEIARYIVANPLRAGLAEHIGDYALWDAVWL